MARQDTRNQSSFTRPGKVTYQFGSASEVIITLPPDSGWTSGLHWHETHTEFLQIVKGKATITVGEIQRNWGPDDGNVRIDKFVRHEWRRAPDVAGDLIVREWTEPKDGEKEIFFRNLSSFLQEHPDASGWWTVLQMLVIFHDMDNYPVIVGGPAGWLITHLILVLARFAGYFVGLRSTYPEYTPSTPLVGK